MEKKEAAETAEANKAAQGAEPAEVPTWEEAAEAEGCFEELLPEDLDPEFGEAEFDEGDGMLDADAHELLKSVFHSSSKLRLTSTARASKSHRNTSFIKEYCHRV